MINSVWEKDRLPCESQMLNYYEFYGLAFKHGCFQESDYINAQLNRSD